MWRMIAFFAVAALALLIPLNIAGQNAGQNAPAGDVNFSRDVAPILYANCVYCHRPGEIGPMSLITYQQTRPWARAIRQAVIQRKMPPWQADSNFSHFSNSRTLTEDAIRTLVAWVDAGAPEGNPADMPSLPQFAEGWQIGEPDLVLTMAEPFQVPASGTVPWVNLPSNEYVFPEDTWIQAIEVRPGNRAVVHHAVAGAEPDPNNTTCDGSGSLHLYSPGMEAMIWRDGYGKLICKGTRIIFQMHYNAIGTAQSDQTKVGFRFAKAPVHTEVNTTIISNNAMLVPPGTRDHEVIAGFQFNANSRIHAFRPHMHLRARTGTATLVYPDGLRKIMLHIPQWDDGWQNYYVLSEPATVPKGAIVEYVAQYDNSVANPLNPDPTVPVRWGQQIWEEMHSTYMTWTEINEHNKDDIEPIQIPLSKAFTTGLMSSR